MKEKHKRLYMRIAGTVASASTAEKLKVGAVVVKDDRILSIGYNGTPPNYDNVCEDVVDGQLVTRPEVIHAEQNAIYKMARDGQAAKDSVMFVTHAPCMMCARSIATCGISKVYYGHAYRDSSGIEFLSKLGVATEQMENGSWE